jgi:hypothetical protein
VVWQDAKFRWADPSTNANYQPDDPRVTNGAFYLERQATPTRLVVALDFATRNVTQAEPHPATWSMMVGG